MGITSLNGSSNLVCDCAVLYFIIRTDRTLDVLAPIMAWWITFTVVILLLFAVGFNVPGIGAGTSRQTNSNTFNVIPRRGIFHHLILAAD